MKTKSSAVSLGYVILYVKDVPAAQAFYEKAFTLKRGFLHESNAYGEMETGATRLAFVDLSLAKDSLKVAPVTTTPRGAPPASEIALVTVEVGALFEQAVLAGARPVVEPAPKPWGQIVGYVRDPDGHLVELCSPLP
jgi:lactoylglutathione lyase